MSDSFKTAEQLESFLTRALSPIREVPEVIDLTFSPPKVRRHVHLEERFVTFEHKWDTALLDAGYTSDPDLEILKSLMDWICNLSYEARKHYHGRVVTIIQTNGWAFKWEKDDPKLLLVINDTRLYHQMNIWYH